MARLVSGRVKSLARRAGIDVRRHDRWSATAARRARLLRDGAFSLVLDVGANTGQYGTELRTHGYTNDIVSFEPGAAAFARLEPATANDARWRSKRLALGEARASRPLNVASNEGASSSFLPLSEAHGSSAPLVRYVGSETVEMATLDDVVDELLPPKGRVWLKLDVQGYELRVLEGGARTLPRLNAVELELSLVELYEGQPLFCTGSADH